MNKVLLIGRLTKDPETKNVGNDNKVCRFGLAVNRRFKKDENNNADFFNVVA
jgi:single-strand DNA-binding protein